MRTVLFFAAALFLAACGSEPGAAGVAQPDSDVIVAYEGRLADGTVFDRSDRAMFSLTRVVPGFRDGVAGMHTGETKTFTVAPEDGYGANPPPGSDIPPNATLTFEVTLFEVRRR